MASTTRIWFPQVSARDLNGRAVTLPGGLPGEWTVVVVAFRRQQQDLVDSWVAWLQAQQAAQPGLRFVEIPALGLEWRPARPVIDGGMAGAIRDRPTRQRTLTVYTDLRRLTVPLGIAGRETISVFLVSRAGEVAWRGSGGWSEATAADLAAAIARLAGAGQATDRAESGARPDEAPVQFEMAFDPHFRPLLAALGITPATAHVTVTQTQVIACFGPWTCRTDRSNVRTACLTGPYRWYRAIGPRLSLADRGLTFGTSTRRGVCLLFRDPVRGLDPLGRIRHPGLTLTVADPDRLAALLSR